MAEYQILSEKDKEWRPINGDQGSTKPPEIARSASEEKEIAQKPKVELMEIDSKDKTGSLEVVELDGTVDGDEILTNSDSLRSTATEIDRSPENLKANFGAILTEKEVEQLISEKFVPALKRYLKIPLEKIDACEDMHQKKIQGDMSYLDSEDSGYVSSYGRLLQIGLNRTEIISLIKLNNEGGDELRNGLTEYVDQERKNIGEILNNPNTQKKIEACLGMLRELFKQTGLTPIRSGLPVTQFVGKYERMLMDLKAGRSEPSIIHNKGFYLPTRDACAIEIDESNTGQLSKDDIMTYVHENIHALSPTEVCADGENIDFNIDDAKRLKSGFVTKNSNNRRRHHSLEGLNEGNTELLARIVTAKADITRETQDAYDDYVLNATILNQTLEGSPPNTDIQYADIPFSSLKNLLEKYTSRHGTLALAREMNKKIGSKALKLFDLLSNRRSNDFVTFINCLRDFEAGKPSGTIELRQGELDQYGMKFENLHSQYPFLTLKQAEAA